MHKSTKRFNLCYNEACTVGFADSLADVEYAAEAGFDEIELRFDCVQGMLDKGRSLKDLRTALEDTGLILGPVNALYIYPGMFEPDNPHPKACEFRRSFELMKRLRDEVGVSEAIVVSPLFADHAEAARYTRGQALDLSAGALKRLCTLLPGIKLQFEPVGLERSLVRDVAFAREIVGAALSEDVHLVLDSCNLFLKHLQSDYDFSMLRADEIGAVHLMNGQKPDTEGEILDQKWRRLLGDGDWVDTGLFMEEILKTGYCGMISTEVFCDDYAKSLSQAEIVMKAFTSLHDAVVRHTHDR